MASDFWSHFFSVSLYKLKIILFFFVLLIKIIIKNATARVILQQDAVQSTWLLGCWMNVEFYIFFCFFEWVFGTFEYFIFMNSTFVGIYFAWIDSRIKLKLLIFKRTFNESTHGASQSDDFPSYILLYSYTIYLSDCQVRVY